MLAADVVVNEGLFMALIGFGATVFLGVFGWVLTQAVALGKIVSRLEAADADHERRITTLETARQGR